MSGRVPIFKQSATFLVRSIKPIWWIYSSRIHFTTNNHTSWLVPTSPVAQTFSFLLDTQTSTPLPLFHRYKINRNYFPAIIPIDSFYYFQTTPYNILLCIKYVTEPSNFPLRLKNFLHWKKSKNALRKFVRTKSCPRIESIHKTLMPWMDDLKTKKNLTKQMGC